MKPTFNNILCLGAICGVSFLSSCNTVQTTYKEFYQKQDHRKMKLATDGTALQDGKGNTDILLPDQSVKMATQIHSRIAGILRGKGYNTNPKFKSTGLSVPNNLNCIVSNDPKATTGRSLSGPHTMNASSKAQRYAAERLFDRLLTLNLLSSNAKEMTFPEIKDLGASNSEYFVAVSGLSRNVETSKQVGQAVLLAAISLGSVVAWEPDVSIIQAAVIDGRTQKIVWANQVGGSGGKSESVLAQIDTLFKDLPNYGSTGKPE